MRPLLNKLAKAGRCIAGFVVNHGSRAAVPPAILAIIFPHVYHMTSYRDPSSRMRFG